MSRFILALLVMASAGISTSWAGLSCPDLTGEYAMSKADCSQQNFVMLGVLTPRGLVPGKIEIEQKGCDAITFRQDAHGSRLEDTFVATGKPILTDAHHQFPDHIRSAWMRWRRAPFKNYLSLVVDHFPNLAPTGGSSPYVDISRVERESNGDVKWSYGVYQELLFGRSHTPSLENTCVLRKLRK